MFNSRIARPMLAGAIALAFVFSFFAPMALAGEPLKTEANLAAPEGSTSSVKGKAKATFHEKASGATEKLSITLQHLERNVEYRLVVDGIELALVRPKGKSGTVKLSLRRPTKGNQAAIPEAIPPVNTLTTIEVYNVGTSALVATGTFVVVPAE